MAKVTMTIERVVAKPGKSTDLSSGPTMQVTLSCPISVGAFEALGSRVGQAVLAAFEPVQAEMFAGNGAEEEKPTRRHRSMKAKITAIRRKSAKATEQPAPIG